MATRTRRMPDVEDAVRPRRVRKPTTAQKAQAAPNYLTGSILAMNSPDYILNKLGSGVPPNMYRNEDKYLHVSDLVHKCMRMFALAEFIGVKLVGETMYDNMGVTFAIGKAIGQYLVDRSIIAVPDKLWGNWVCACGVSKFQGTYHQAAQLDLCPKCSTKMLRYIEACFTNDEYNISGSVDLIYLISKHLYLIEVKSIKKETWNDMVRPQPDHLLQLVFYWWLASLRGYSLYEQASVIYTSKAHTRGSPFKEFAVNPANHIDRLRPYLEDAMSLKQHRAGGALPPRLCANDQVSTAKSCLLCTTCFGV